MDKPEGEEAASIPGHRYVAPAFRLDGFNCPHCGAFAHQQWHQLTVFEPPFSQEVRGHTVARCGRCGKLSVWIDKEMRVPVRGAAPLAHADMPKGIARDYEEAASISCLSPRGAAALLRLCIEKLCEHLDAHGKNLNERIAVLVQKGLPVRIQRALDSVRVIGNEGIHPGQMDIRDDAQVATLLFELVNLIVDRLISEPQKVDAIYARLPEPKREAIEKRDKKE